MTTKRRIFIIPVCFLLFLTVTLTACGSEKAEMQERIDTLESENETLRSGIASATDDLTRTQTELYLAQSELQSTLLALEAALSDAQSSQQDSHSGPLAITYGGRPNTDMTWPLTYGDLALGLRVNASEIDEDEEIIWHSENESIFSVIPSEDGLNATVTPYTKGSAQLVVTIGDQVTKSWVRIT